MNLSRIERIQIEATARQYIEGRLSEDEEAQFETRMIRDPRIAQEVEITRRMRDGLRHLHRTGALDLVTPPPLSMRPRVQLAVAADNVMNWVKRPQLTSRSRIQLAAAAAAVTVLAATAFYYLRPAPPPTLLAASVDKFPQFGAASEPMSYVLAQRRTEDNGVVIPKPDSHGVIQLNLLPARTGAAGPYRVELRRAEAAAVSEPLARIQAGSANQVLVPVFLNASGLETGRYVLSVIEPEISGRSPATTRYTFTLVTDTAHRDHNRPDE
jgi:hypothetical protein